MPDVRFGSNATEMAEAYDRDVCLAAKAISLLQGEHKLLRLISTRTMSRVRRIVGRRQRKHCAAWLRELRLDPRISLDSRDEQGDLRELLL